MTSWKKKNLSASHDIISGLGWLFMTLSDEDKALFRSVVRDVNPLHSPKISLQKPNPPTVPKIKKVQPPPPPSRNYETLSNHYPESCRSEDILSYCKQSIPKKRLHALKTGKIPWEGTLDLHGFTPESAQNILCESIHQHIRQSHRCLLIIHGKGGRFGEAPILKNHVNHWLRQLPQVLAFHSALPRDGGTGALYLLLQRSREAYDI